MLRDKGAFLLLVGAPVLYGFFYPWFYSTAGATRARCCSGAGPLQSGAADVALCQASPRIHPQLVTADEGEARAAVLRGEVAAMRCCRAISSAMCCAARMW
jgi:ABC-2 type transport system permease protein